MKTTLVLLAASLFLAACASTPGADAPDASPSGQPAQGATFEAAVAAAHLTKVAVEPVERTKEYAISEPAVKVEGRRVSFVLRAGWNGEGLELARDASGRIVRLVRQPEVTVKEVVVQGCQEHVFGGGRAWFERVVIELPPGTTWGGDHVVKYREIKEVTRFTGKKPDGTDCPPPHFMHD